MIKLIKWGEMAMMERYKAHVIGQALTLLRAHPNIQCIFTTPKLLEAKGIFRGATYGNTLISVAHRRRLFPLFPL
ncbi:MAG: hypothetical protein LC126_07720 [Bryobacterales bacterium]|nr:hypothetical protein [Bryobacterales bacterium]